MEHKDDGSVSNEGLLLTLMTQSRMAHNMGGMTESEALEHDPQLKMTFDAALRRMRPDLTSEEKAELENVRTVLAQSRRVK